MLLLSECPLYRDIFCARIRLRAGLKINQRLIQLLSMVPNGLQVVIYRLGNVIVDTQDSGSVILHTPAPPSGRPDPIPPPAGQPLPFWRSDPDSFPATQRRWLSPRRRIHHCIPTGNQAERTERNRIPLNRSLEVDFDDLCISIYNEMGMRNRSNNASH